MRPDEVDRLRVSVVYLRPGLSFERDLLLPAPATLGEAIEASDLRREVPELAAAELDVGVFGQRRRLADVLHDGDRVEIYRPLRLDPNATLRQRERAKQRRQR